MSGITDLLTNFIRDILTGWILSNFSNMFGDVNDKVDMVAGEVAKTPSTWNPGIFNMIHSLSDSVMVPIGGMVISGILCYELISMIMDKNNMRDFDTSLFIRYLGKACIAVVLLSKCFDITMAIFDVGSHIVTEASSVIVATADIDIESSLISVFNNQLAGMNCGELFRLALETMIVSFCMEALSVAITVVLYGRMMEIYLYISVSPVTFSTLGNREWGNIGTNYIRGLIALAFQGFFLMVCVGIYAALVAGITVSTDIHKALWSVVGYTLLLCTCMMNTSSLSRSIFHAH